MPGKTTVIPLRFKAYIDVTSMDGVTILKKCPITHATMNFALGGIGTATFIVATGMHAQTRIAAHIHSYTEKFDNQLIVSCWMETDGWWDERTPWPRRVFRIWEGVTSGLNFTFNRQALSLQLGSTHWLTRLDNASLSSGNILKGSCDTFTTAFGIEMLGEGNVLASEGALLKLANRGVQNPDFWKDVVKQMILGLTDVNHKKIKAGSLNWRQTFSQFANCKSRSDVKHEVEIGNKEATDIINKRFDDFTQIIPGVLKGNFPLIFKAAKLEESYLNILARIIGNRFGSATALEKVYACAQMFMYNIAYNVESATNIPFVPVLKSDKLWRTLNASEYGVIRATGYTPPEIAGVGVYGQNQTAFMGDSPQSQPNIPDSQQIIGAFKASDRGKFLMIDAPPYLWPQVRHSANKANLATAQSAVGSPTTKKQPPGIDAAINDAVSSVGCMYARLKYFDTVFALRTATLSGKLRFDIAPGSMIRLKNAGIKLPQFHTPELFATVSSVTVVLDAQDGHAITNFGLSHLRTAKEDDFAPTAHPFFPEKPWIGSPLVRIFDNDLTPEKS
jgi:hypothetical protein